MERIEDSYPVDLTSATSGLISLPPFHQALKYTIQNQLCPNGNVADFPQSLVGSAISHSNQNTFNFQVKQEPNSQIFCYTVPVEGENFTICTEPVEIVDQMLLDEDDEETSEPMLKIELPDESYSEKESKEEEQIQLSNNLFGSLFNVSSCGDEKNEANTSLDFSALAADEMLEQIQNAVDFSNVAGNCEQPDMNNILISGCPTPDTLSASSTCSPSRRENDFVDLGMLGSFPEHRIQQLNQNLPQSVIEFMQQQQAAENFSESKSTFRQMATCTSTTAAQASNSCQQYYQHQTFIKVEKQEENLQSSIGIMQLTQNLYQQFLTVAAPTAVAAQSPSPATTFLAATPTPMLPMYNQNTFIQQQPPPQYPPPPAYQAHISPLGENNLTSFTNFSNSLQHSDCSFSSCLENVFGNTSTPVKPRKPRKRKQPVVKSETTDPQILRHVEGWLKELGLPPNYPLEYVNGGHGIKNPHAISAKLARSTVTAPNDGSNAASPLPTSFTCNVCLKTFKLQRLLNRHLKSHSEIKRYLCFFCRKGFNDSFDLKRHTRTHTGIRPFKCQYCVKTFTQRCSLESHCKKLHKVESVYKYKERRVKMYVCEECGETSNTSESHYMHLESNHPNSPALCKFYDKRYFKFTDSQFANNLLGKMKPTAPIVTGADNNFV